MKLKIPGLNKHFSWKTVKKSDATKGFNIHFDSIPYSCHYCADTLLTQSGDMLQTIKIDLHENFTIKNKDSLELIHKVRKAIIAVGESGNLDVAFCLHTVRRSENVADRPRFSSKFACRIHTDWCQNINVEREYFNVVYITILAAGIREKKFKPYSFFEHLFLGLIKRRYMAAHAKIKKKLDMISAQLMGAISDLKPRKLGIFKLDNHYYSEITNDLAKITKLSIKDQPLEAIDLTAYFANANVVFGHNTFEIDYGSEKKFGCMLSVKEAVDTTSENLDIMLARNHEFVITETITFTCNTKSEIKEIKYQEYLLTISNEKELIKDIQLNNFEQKFKVPGLMVNRHISIMLIDSTIAGLNAIATDLDGVFSNFGYMVYRHNLGMEQIYWSQLPGNFSFLTHIRKVDPMRLGTFIHLSSNRVTEGWLLPWTYLQEQSSRAVRVLLHRGGCAHTLILGHNDSNRVLSHFLIAQSQKFHPCTLYLDIEPGKNKDSNAAFVKLLGGVSTESFDSEEFRTFLKHVLGDNPFNIDGIVELLHHNDKDSLSALVDTAAFDSVPTSLPKTSSTADAVLHLALNNSEHIDCILYVIAIVQSMKKEPMVIAINGLWRASGAHCFGEGIEKFVSKMAKINVAVIFNFDAMDEDICIGSAKNVSKVVQNQIFMPTVKARERYGSLGLDNYAIDWLSMVARKGLAELLIKNGAVINAMKFEYECVPIFSMLAPQDEAMEFIKKCLQEYGDDVNLWIDRIAF